MQTLLWFGGSLLLDESEPFWPSQREDGEVRDILTRILRAFVAAQAPEFPSSWQNGVSAPP
jgi:hypothetical protein